MNIKRSIYMLLAFLIILSTAVYAGNNNYDGDNPFWSGTDEEWQVYKDSQGLGYEITKSIIANNGSTVCFNRELWEEKGLVVYGDYSLIANNDKKTAANGYYKGGEYRFHGYDISGNKHDNTDFPPDQEANIGVEKINWVYRPWMQGSKGYRIYKQYVGDISIYNGVATNEDKFNNYPESVRLTVAKWINDSQDWTIRRVYENESNGNIDFSNFLSVQTAPTPHKSGQGTMIHIDKTGNDHYYTFSLSQIIHLK